MAGDIEEQLAIQLRRIEAVHRGFLYQHLFAVGCLFLGGIAGVRSVVVEQDEDIELYYDNRRRYIQIKTRAGVVVPADIATTLARFRDLRDLHEAGARQGEPEFWLVANVELSRSARECLAASGVEVTVHTPEVLHEDPRLPPAWPSLTEGVEWCKRTAATVPFTRLSPDTLVWKLASEVAWACTGTRIQGHSFDIAGLNTLFEQFATALQRLPTPPDIYRSQINEPELESDRPVRLIVGLSGGGKTAWAATHALHAAGEVVYFDSAGVPSGVAPSALAREFAAKLLARTGGAARDVFLPGATGVDSLRLVAQEATRSPAAVLLIYDNAQVVEVDVLRHMVAATPGCRWVFLARPWPGGAALEAHLNIQHETLEGFSLQDIAAEFRMHKVAIDVMQAERIRRTTGGLPLFVRDAARLTAQRYTGGADTFCAAIESRTNPYVNGQDVIVQDVISHVSAGDRNVASVIALSELALTRDEVTELTTQALAVTPAVAMVAVRALSAWGIVQESLAGGISIHDAFRGALADVRAQVDSAIIDLGYRTLGKILVKSFGPDQFDRLVQFCRISPRIGEVQTLIDVSSGFSEQLQERGKAEELIRIVDDAANNETLSAIERFWAADTVAFWRIWGSEAEVEADIARLASLLAMEPKPPSRAIVNLEMKRLVLAGRRRDLDTVRGHYATALRTSGSSMSRRIVRYNHAVALQSCHADQSALFVCAALVRDYFSHFRITPANLFMANLHEIQGILGGRAAECDELKRFADCLQLSALAANRLGRPGGLVRIWSHKLYLLTWAPRSAVRVGMDVVDEMLSMLGDPVGARQFIERSLTPTVNDMKLLAYIVPVQAQYAVVRAYCGDYDEARRLISELRSFTVDEESAAELENQRRLIEQIAAGQRQMRPLPPPPGAGPLPVEFVALPERGRNDQCFCQSGLKHKQCCGRQDM